MILIDTHVVVWLTIEPDKMPKSTGKLVAEARSRNTGIGYCGYYVVGTGDVDP